MSYHNLPPQERNTHKQSLPIRHVNVITLLFKGKKYVMKKLIAAFVLLFMITFMVVACGGGTSSGASNEVHMGSSNFVQSSITISKGSSITLIDDMAVTHIISNGMWVNGTPKPQQEAGAPVVKNMTFNSSGQTQTIGPFNTAGTFHYYCSVHVNMNLTVIVQ